MSGKFSYRFYRERASVAQIRPVFTLASISEIRHRMGNKYRDVCALVISCGKENSRVLQSDTQRRQQRRRRRRRR